MLTEITAEQRQEMQIKAALKREADKKFAKENLRNDFADIHNWRRMASTYKIRLPSWYVRNTRTIRRAGKQLGLTGTWVTEATGHSSLQSLMDDNPAWPSYAFIGLMLETVHEAKGQALVEVDELIAELI